MTFKELKIMIFLNYIIPYLDEFTITIKQINRRVAEEIILFFDLKQLSFIPDDKILLNQPDIFFPTKNKSHVMPYNMLQP
jgi:hypothetical protein